jgi:hypothetical protein
MRTKTLLIAAAVLAAGIASSVAQTVYSANIVGYVNLTVQPGFNLLGNQLVPSSGTNDLNDVFPSVPDGTLLYKFNSATASFSVDVYNAQVSVAPVGWYDNTTLAPSTTTVGPGDGFFLNNPGSATTITLVGSVATGTNTISLPAGFSLIASATPESYQLLSPDFPAIDGALYYGYSSGAFTVDVFNNNPSVAAVGWYDNTTLAPATVQPAVGQGFFFNNPGSATVWTRVFNP